MRLAVFGATGRAGGAIAAQARAAGHEVRILARPADDVRDEAAVERVVKDTDAVSVPSVAPGATILPFFSTERPPYLPPPIATRCPG